jgi:hypothetical protein
VEDPDLLEQIRLTIINNLLKYHPVCLQFSLSLYRNHIHIQRGLHAAVFFFFFKIAVCCFSGNQLAKCKGLEFWKKCTPKEGNVYSAYWMITFVSCVLYKLFSNVLVEFYKEACSH